MNYVHRGIADFSLDWGQCPKWLFERMVRLAREIVQVMIAEYGADEFVARISDPVWFQSLGTVLAFDWNASGLTTTLTAALKKAIQGQEKELGLFICGGKGKTSRKTPNEILSWGEKLSLPEKKTQSLVYSSRMSAKVDSSLVQDGYQIYHHVFFFSKNGAWSVVQQGMNIENQTARRYHWFSEDTLINTDKNTDKHRYKNFVVEPHSGIVGEKRQPAILNLVAQESDKTRQVSTELVQVNYPILKKDIELLRCHASDLVKSLSVRQGSNQFTWLKLTNKEFHFHPVMLENFFASKYLHKILWQLCDIKPKDYETLLSIQGVGPKTIRALALVSEVIYGAQPSFKDPARYSFAHGGKDGTPYFVERQTYDKTIETMKEVVKKTKLDLSEKKKIFQRLELK